MPIPARLVARSAGRIVFSGGNHPDRGKEPQKILANGLREEMPWKRCGRNDEAIASYSRVIELEPENRTAWGERGKLYYRKADWPSIFSDLERRRLLEPTDAQVANDLVWCLGTCPDLRYRDQKRAVRNG